MDRNSQSPQDLTLPEGFMLQAPKIMGKSQTNRETTLLATTKHASLPV
jgi:hypothetical protein